MKNFSRGLILRVLVGWYAGVSWSEDYAFLVLVGWVALVDFTLKLV